MDGIFRDGREGEREAENCDGSVLEKWFCARDSRDDCPPNEYCARDLRLLLPAGSLPPDFGIFRTIEHVRQFLFDLAQTGGAELECRLIESIVTALFCETGVQVAQVGDFLTKAGEVFRNIGHLFHHTPYLSKRL